MNETNIFQANSPQTHPSADGKKPSFVPALVLGILAIVLGLLIPLVGRSSPSSVLFLPWSSAKNTTPRLP